MEKNGNHELNYCISTYRNKLTEEHMKQFYSEVYPWIKQRWLKPALDNGAGIIPLMAVVQTNKEKVRSVLDYRELNDHVAFHVNDDVAVCEDSIWRWRKYWDKTQLLDLRSAYLQIHVDKTLQRFQRIHYRDRTYRLT